MLTFMRSCTFDSDPVLAIYVTKAAMFTTHSAASLKSGLGLWVRKTHRI